MHIRYRHAASCDRRQDWPTAPAGAKRIPGRRGGELPSTHFSGGMGRRPKISCYIARGGHMEPGRLCCLVQRGVPAAMRGRTGTLFRIPRRLARPRCSVSRHAGVEPITPTRRPETNWRCRLHLCTQIGDYSPASAEFGLSLAKRGPTLANTLPNLCPGLPNSNQMRVNMADIGPTCSVVRWKDAWTPHTLRAMLRSPGAPERSALSTRCMGNPGLGEACSASFVRMGMGLARRKIVTRGLPSRPTS